MKIKGDVILLDDVTKPKKITGTRFASVVGLNPYNSPFKTWCEITKVYQEPFTGNAYTEAGQKIEPIVIQYLRDKMFYRGIITPEQKYGENPSKSQRGDFFKKPIFGGMWDGLNYEDGELAQVVEIKTAGKKKRAQWEKQPPDFNTLQACLYCELIGVKDFIITGSFLDTDDYVKPEEFKPSYKNTLVYEYNVDDDYPQFYEYLNKAEQWYKKYVLGGISPPAITNDDKEILDIIKLKNGEL